MAAAEKVRILFLPANPADTKPLELGEESHEIQHALDKGSKKAKFQLEQRWAVRVSELKTRLLQVNPHIVHFSGHGSKQSGIVLQDEAGRYQFVTGAALGELFSLLNGHTCCAVMNVCYSRAHANSVAGQVECVVAMADEISDQAAIGFSSGFYEALSQGKSIAQAFREGVIQVHLLSPDERDIPQLVCRPGVDADKVYVLKRLPLAVPFFLKAMLVMALPIVALLLLRFFFKLPDEPSRLETIMHIGSEQGCGDLKHSYKKELEAEIGSWKTPFAVTVAQSNDFDAELAFAKASDADHLLWFGCNQQGGLEKLVSMALQHRGSPEVFEKLSETLKNLEKEPARDMVRAIAHFAYHDFPKASELLEKALKQETDDANRLAMQLWLGNALIYLRRYQDAATHFRQLVEENRSFAYLRHNQGIAEMYAVWNHPEEKRSSNPDEIREFEPAKNSFGEALKINPDFELSKLALALIKFRLGLRMDKLHQLVKDSEDDCFQSIHSTGTGIRALAVSCFLPARNAICESRRSASASDGTDKANELRRCPQNPKQRYVVADRLLQTLSESNNYSMAILIRAFYETNQDTGQSIASGKLKEALESSYSLINLENSRTWRGIVAERYCDFKFEGLLPLQMTCKFLVK